MKEGEKLEFNRGKGKTWISKKEKSVKERELGGKRMKWKSKRGEMRK